MYHFLLIITAYYMLIGCMTRTPSKLSVVGGLDADQKYDFYAAIIYAEDRSLQCGGSLIAPNIILTAAHCMYQEDIQDFKVVVNPPTLPAPKDTTAYKIKQVLIHPDFELGNNIKSIKNDIAIIVMNKHFKNISFAKLANTSRSAEYMKVIGFGNTTSFGEKQPKVLQEAEVKIISAEKCRSQLDQSDIDSNLQICAGDGVTDSCDGDSGGPLFMLDKDGHAILHGIVSSGPSYCAQKNAPALYTNIVGHKEWLSKALDKNSLERKFPGLTKKLTESCPIAIENQFSKILEPYSASVDYGVSFVPGSADLISSKEFIDLTEKYSSIHDTCKISLGDSGIDTKIIKKNDGDYLWLLKSGNKHYKVQSRSQMLFDVYTGDASIAVNNAGDSIFIEDNYHHWFGSAISFQNAPDMKTMKHILTVEVYRHGVEVFAASNHKRYIRLITPHDNSIWYLASEPKDFSDVYMMITNLPEEDMWNVRIQNNLDINIINWSLECNAEFNLYTIAGGLIGSAQKSAHDAFVMNFGGDSPYLHIDSLKGYDFHIEILGKRGNIKDLKCNLNNEPFNIIRNFIEVE